MQQISLFVQPCLFLALQMFSPDVSSYQVTSSYSKSLISLLIFESQDAFYKMYAKKCQLGHLR